MPLDLAKKNQILRLEQNIIEEETRSSKSFVDEYTRHFTSDEMISGPEKELEYTKDIHVSIDADDLNNYFKKYNSGVNQILSLKAPDYIQDLPNEKELKALIAKIKNEKIEQNQPKKLSSQSKLKIPSTHSVILDVTQLMNNKKNIAFTTPGMYTKCQSRC